MAGIVVDVFVNLVVESRQLLRHCRKIKRPLRHSTGLSWLTCGGGGSV